MPRVVLACSLVAVLVGCTNTVGDVPDSGIVQGAEGEGEGEGQEGEGEGACSPDPVFGLEVIAEDVVTQFPVCDATVRITEGNFTETLAPRGDAADCSYVGAADRPGTYDIAIEHPSYAPASRTGIEVSSTADGCHVVLRRLEIGLDPPDGEG